MARLEGKIIAVTGPRKAEEMSRMIAKFGGETVIRPAQGTVFLDDSLIESQLMSFIDLPPDWLLLTTGVGTEALVQTADKLGLVDHFIEAMKRVNVAARGYKTVNVLRKLGITPLVRDNDGTTAGMLREMSGYDLTGKRVILQLYGDPAPRVTGMLRQRGAMCEELLPYRHVPPEGDSLERLIREVIQGEVDAVAFTSTVQVRCVMHAAAALGLQDELLRALDCGTLAVAVGKVTAEALYEEGVQKVLYPEEERMGSMIVALSRHYNELQVLGGTAEQVEDETVEGEAARVAGDCSRTAVD